MKPVIMPFKFSVAALLAALALAPSAHATETKEPTASHWGFNLTATCGCLASRVISRRVLSAARSMPALSISTTSHGAFPRLHGPR